MWTKYEMGQTITYNELKKQFGTCYLDVIGDLLEVFPRQKHGRPKYRVKADLPAEDQYMEMYSERFTTTVESLIADAFSEISELGNSLRKVLDNTPYFFKDNDIDQRRKAAVKTLESCTGCKPAVPEECSGMQVLFVPARDLSNRPKRAINVQDMLDTAAEEIRSYVEEQAGKDLSYLKELVSQLAEVSEEIGNVDFPGICS